MVTRIEGTDTMTDVVMKMSEGNTGAMVVCTEISKRGGEIDSDAAIGSLAAFLSLDTHGIYGSRIWMLYKDVCSEDLPTMLAVNRACQLGLISRSVLDTAIDNCGKGIDVSDIIRRVKERLPAFDITVRE